jgi:hypothetical protein
MKRIALFGVLGLGLAFALACGGGDGTSKPRVPRDAGPEGYKAHYEGGCDAILGEFKADEKAAHDKYKFKTYFITGKLQDDVGSTKVAFESAAGGCFVNVFSGSAHKEAKAAWKKGAEAKALCHYDKFEGGAISFKDCSPYTK